MAIQRLSSPSQQMKEQYVEKVSALLATFSFSLYLDEQSIEREYFTNSKEILSAKQVYDRRNWGEFISEYKYVIDGHIIHRNQSQIADDYYEWITEKRSCKTVQNRFSDPVGGGFDVWLKEVVQCVVFVRHGEEKFSQNAVASPTFTDAAALDLYSRVKAISDSRIRRFRKINKKYSKFLAAQPDKMMELKEWRDKEVAGVQRKAFVSLDRLRKKYPLLLSDVMPRTLLPQNLPKKLP